MFNEKAIKERVFSPTQKKEKERVSKEFIEKRTGRQEVEEDPRFESRTSDELFSGNAGLWGIPKPL